MGGHGGMDFLMLYRIIECLRGGLPLDQNVYEGCFWSSVAPLSEKSVKENGAPQDFPDFTRGELEDHQAAGRYRLTRGRSRAILAPRAQMALAVALAWRPSAHGGRRCQPRALRCGPGRCSPPNWFGFASMKTPALLQPPKIVALDPPNPLTAFRTRFAAALDFGGRCPAHRRQSPGGDELGRHRARSRSCQRSP